jgi:hypothetical protein
MDSQLITDITTEKEGGLGAVWGKGKICIV